MLRGTTRRATYISEISSWQKAEIYLISRGFISAPGVGTDPDRHELGGSANGFVVLSPLQMPVCSYFLKGICSNSNCPYSHVYVSRKAEVCQDFLKGYCPMGEKVKRFRRSGRDPRRLLGVPASLELFFTRATAPKGAVELEAAEHLDGMSKTKGFTGRAALFLRRQGKIEREQMREASSMFARVIPEPCA